MLLQAASFTAIVNLQAVVKPSPHFNKLGQLSSGS